MKIYEMRYLIELTWLHLRYYSNSKSAEYMLRAKQSLAAGFELMLETGFRRHEEALETLQQEIARKTGS